eukprot:6491679-Amphidinium_carterae.2
MNLESPELGPSHKWLSNSHDFIVLVGDGFEFVSHWKQKLNPASILECWHFDGRSRAGLENRIEIMEEKDQHRLAQVELKKHLKVIQMTEKFVKGNLLTMDGTELHGALRVYKENNIALPLKVTIDLVQRRTDDLMAQGAFKQVLHIMNVFLPDESFDALEPKMCSLDLDFPSKLQTYNKVIFESLLVDWLKKGADGAKMILNISLEAVVENKSIDIVELEQDAAAVFNMQLQVWKSLVVLASDDVVYDYLD